MDVAIVTGVSKGLGEQIAQCLLTEGIGVIGVSRTENTTLSSIAEKHDTLYRYVCGNLNDMNAVSLIIDEVSDVLGSSDVDQLYVVNNAAMLEPVGFAHQLNGNAIREHYALNVFAPMDILQGVLHFVEKRDITVTCGNITSGAATSAIAGWSAYSSAKAAINAYTRTVAKEQELLGTTHQLFAFSPGVMDTNMQQEIRSADEDVFPDVDVFRGYKEAGRLVQPEVVAQVFVDILLKKKGPLQSGEVYHISDYL